ncbi:unnamed protein product, partial [Prorocentrum cordatum]
WPRFLRAPRSRQRPPPPGGQDPSLDCARPCRQQRGRPPNLKRRGAASLRPRGAPGEAHRDGTDDVVAAAAGARPATAPRAVRRASRAGGDGARRGRRIRETTAQWTQVVRRLPKRAPEASRAPAAPLAQEGQGEALARARLAAASLLKKLGVQCASRGGSGPIGIGLGQDPQGYSNQYQGLKTAPGRRHRGRPSWSECLRDARRQGAAA